MSARPIGEIIPEVLDRAARISLLCEFINAFPCPSERKLIIMRLYEAQIIRSETAELLIDHFGLEAA